MSPMPSMLPGEPPGDSGTAGRAQRELLCSLASGQQRTASSGPLPPGARAGGLQLICKLLLRATEESALFCLHNQVK